MAATKRRSPLDSLFVPDRSHPANYQALRGLVELRRGEIVIDERCRTSVPIYAAGDYDGALQADRHRYGRRREGHALTAFDDRIRSAK